MEVVKIFNENQKQEFLSQEELYPVALKQYFDRLSEAEQSYNKDLADMNIEELKAALTSLYIRSIVSRGHVISVIKRYIEWAIKNHKTENKNVIDSLKPEDIGSPYAIQTKMLREPEQVRHILNTVYNPDFYLFTNRANQEKLIFWLLYSGLTIDSLPLLKKLDIDTENRLIRNPSDASISIETNDEVITLWDRQTRITQLEKRGAYHIKDVYFSELVDSDYLLRPIKGNKINTPKLFTESSIVNTVVKIFKEYNRMTSIKLAVSPINMKISGIFYKLYIQERNGIELTPEAFNQYFNVGYSNTYDLSVKMRKYCIDYNEWKQAFGF